MPRHQICSIPGCSSRSDRQEFEGVKFHCIPQDPDLRHDWLVSIHFFHPLPLYCFLSSLYSYDLDLVILTDQTVMETVVTVIMAKMAMEMVVEMVMAPFHYHPLGVAVGSSHPPQFQALPQNQTHPRSFQEPLLLYT